MRPAAPDSPPLGGRWLGVVVLSAGVTFFGGVLPLVNVFTPAREEPASLGEGNIDLVTPERREGSFSVPRGWWRPDGHASDEGDEVSLTSTGASVRVRIVAISPGGACADVVHEAGRGFEVSTGALPAGPAPITTATGAPAVRTEYTSSLVQGTVAVACGDGVALVVTAIAPFGSSGHVGPVDEILSSARFP